MVVLDPAATSTAPSESECNSSFLNLADGIVVFLFREGVVRVLFGGVGDHVWSDRRSGEGTVMFTESVTVMTARRALFLGGGF